MVGGATAAGAIGAGEGLAAAASVGATCGVTGVMRIVSRPIDGGFTTATSRFFPPVAAPIMSSSRPKAAAPPPAYSAIGVFRKSRAPGIWSSCGKVERSIGAYWAPATAPPPSISSRPSKITMKRTQELLSPWAG